MVIVEAIQVGLDVLSVVFDWLFSNMYTAILIGIALIMAVVGIILNKVKG